MTAVDQYFLSKGAHPSPEAGRCAMEWVAFIAGEPHSDHPVCVSPLLQSFCIAFNDRLGDEDRQKLRPYLARCIGTAGDGLDGQRQEILREWLVRTAMPDWLDLAGRTELAQRLRDMLRDMPGALVQDNALRLIREARDEAFSAREGARRKLREQVKARFGATAYAAAADAAAAYAADADAAYAYAYAAYAAAYAAYAAAYAAYAAAAYAAAAYAAAAYAAAPSLSAFKKSVYDHVRQAMDAKLKPIADKHNREGFDLLDRMLPKVALELPAEAAERAIEVCRI